MAKLFVEVKAIFGICRPVWYCVGGQAAEPAFLPSFLPPSLLPSFLPSFPFPLSSCCGHCKALLSPCILSFLLSEGQELCNQWGWSFPCTFGFIYSASPPQMPVVWGVFVLLSCLVRTEPNKLLSSYPMSCSCELCLSLSLCHPFQSKGVSI